MEPRPGPASPARHARRPHKVGLGSNPGGGRGPAESRTRQPSPGSKAALPFREMFHPLQVPTGEVVQGKRRPLQHRHEPHGLLQGCQPQRLETEHRHRVGVAPASRASHRSRRAGTPTLWLGGRGNGPGGPTRVSGPADSTWTTGRPPSLTPPEPPEDHSLLLLSLTATRPTLHHGTCQAVLPLLGHRPAPLN